MSGDKSSEGQSSGLGSEPKFGSALRMALFYVVLIAIPIGVYFSFYVDTREEQTEVRNFRVST